jgi:hypothetical protein
VLVMNASHPSQVLSKVQRRYSVPRMIAKAKLGELLELDEEIAGKLLANIRPDRIYTSEAQSWGMVFRLLQFADLEALLVGGNRRLVTESLKVWISSIKILFHTRIYRLAWAHQLRFKPRFETTCISSWADASRLRV